MDRTEAAMLGQDEAQPSTIIVGWSPSRVGPIALHWERSGWPEMWRDPFAKHLWSFWPILISPRMYKLSFPDANTKDKVTFFVPWIRAAECNFAYITENPEVVLFVQMQASVLDNGFTPYCVSCVGFTLCHLFQLTLTLLNNLTWSNNLEILLSFQMWSSLFYHNMQEHPKVAVLQEMWSSWSFLPGRTPALMTSSWLLNLKCLLFLLEWHIIFWWLNNWYIICIYYFHIE